ncbi:hypothetical protein BV22DRAFT_1003338 [Leucogyrophana mollusca]|uniref:Uncharacterized protein n=1 Tax=Leucogyrophana mollusca TaxID=85980 RepID=A0ACB8BT84_9AGAM|nr:hypothetical protein BV22DRAFT_1003338 [Leucogyrophana mollusca]
MVATCLGEFQALGTFTVCLLVLIALYTVLGARFTTIKQRSWVLTTISSATMTIASLPLVSRYASSPGDPTRLGTSTYWTVLTSRYFQAYLVADLLMGWMHYRKQVNILTGWIHHTIYIFIVEYAIRMGWSHIFCLCAVMEIPTFVLALGSLYPALRADMLFAASFFATRISLHIALCISFITNRRSMTGGSLAPAAIMGCIFPLHAFWFYGCLKGFVRRARVKSEPHVIKLQVVPETPTPVTSIASPMVASVHPSKYWSFPRRRGSIRVAMRSFSWDFEHTRAKAVGRFGEVRRRLRASLPGRASVYAYVGLDHRGQLQAANYRLSGAYPEEEQEVTAAH